MIAIEELFKQSPYNLDSTDKSKFFINYLNQLTEFHKSNSREYANILENFNFKMKSYDKLNDFPYLPVSLFKELELKSISDSEIIKVLTSSGTTSQRVSKIFLDKKTATYQVKALSCILKSFLGNSRAPMIIVDSEDIFKSDKASSARAAGILGVSNFGKNHLFLLDSDMKIKWDALEEFMKSYSKDKILIFGFTFMVWKYLYQQIKENNKVNLENAVLIHSGGWKKLISEKVDNEKFKASLYEKFKIKKVHNFYGMVEQTGSVYMECEEGHLHTSNFSDISILDPISKEPLENGKEGLICTYSVLPHSYPGHILLTEDLGTVISEDRCPCKRKGKIFKVNGRLPQVELRGCSDVIAYEGLKNEETY